MTSNDGSLPLFVSIGLSIVLCVIWRIKFSLSLPYGNSGRQMVNVCRWHTAPAISCRAVQGIRCRSDFLRRQVDAGRRLATAVLPSCADAHPVDVASIHSWRGQLPAGSSVAEPANCPTGCAELPGQQQTINRQTLNKVIQCWNWPKRSGGADVEMFEILPRDWNLQPIFTQKRAFVDLNGVNPPPPLTLHFTISQSQSYKLNPVNANPKTNCLYRLLSLFLRFW